MNKQEWRWWKKEMKEWRRNVLVVLLLSMIFLWVILFQNLVRFRATVFGKQWKFNTSNVCIILKKSWPVLNSRYQLDLKNSYSPIHKKIALQSGNILKSLSAFILKYSIYPSSDISLLRDQNAKCSSLWFLRNVKNS